MLPGEWFCAVVALAVLPFGSHLRRREPLDAWASRRRATGAT
jgi:hypothetical protein